MDEKTRKTLVAMFGMLVLLEAFLIHRMPTNMFIETNQAKKKSGPIVGASFSPWHADWLSRDHQGPHWEKSLEAIVSDEGLGIKRIRLSVPWNAVERVEKKYDFGPEDWLRKAIAICEKHKAGVILCVGLKTPRYPEYHPPAWVKVPSRGSVGEMGKGLTESNYLANQITVWVMKLVEALKDEEAIIAWQVENEPTTFTRSINRELLKREIETTRAFDDKANRQILLTSWTAVDAPQLPAVRKENETEEEAKARVRRELLPMRLFLGLEPSEVLMPTERLIVEAGFATKIENLFSMDDLIAWGDWVGLDVYMKSDRFETTEAQFAVIEEAGRRIKSKGRRFIVSELQAEPWEKDQQMDFENPSANRSLDPVSYLKLFERVAEWQPDEVWLWGLEFQLTCQKRKNPFWIEATKSILAKYATR